MNVETSHSIYLASRGNRPQAATAHSPHSTHTHMERRSLSVDWPFQGWHKPHVFLHFLNAARRLRHLPFLRNFLHFFHFLVSVQFCRSVFAEHSRWSLGHGCTPPPEMPVHTVRPSSCFFFKHRPSPPSVAALRSSSHPHCSESGGGDGGIGEGEGGRCVENSDGDSPITMPAVSFESLSSAWARLASVKAIVASP